MYMIIIIHYLSMKIIVSMQKVLNFSFMEVIRLKALENLLQGTPIEIFKF